MRLMTTFIELVTTASHVCGLSFVFFKKYQQKKSKGGEKMCSYPSKKINPNLDHKNCNKSVRVVNHVCNKMAATCLTLPSLRDLG